MVLQVGEKLRLNARLQGKMLNYLRRYLRMKGLHHITPDEQGRFVVQGLLTATLPTKVGGDYNVLARTMNFEFYGPFIVTTPFVVMSSSNNLNQMKKSNSYQHHLYLHQSTQQRGVKGSFSGIIL